MADAEKVRVAACGCGGLKATVIGAPERVNVCSCENCQRRSGSAFSYTAFFPDSAIVAIEGEHRTWRDTAANGNWLDRYFCPVCGVMVFSRLQSMPGQIAIAVGCFSDPDFEAPPKFYWSSRRHKWLTVPPGLEAIDRQ